MIRDREKFERNTEDCATRKEPGEMGLEELGRAIDNDCKRIGLTLADLYKTVSLAMLSLPNMELHTELMCVAVDDNSITVCVHHPDAGEDFDDDDEGFDDDYEEEEMSYDEYEED